MTEPPDGQRSPGLREFAQRLNADYRDPALFDPGYLSALMGRLVPGERALVLDELLVHYRVFFEAEGARALVNSLVPMLLPGFPNADRHRVADLLQPSGEHPLIGAAATDHFRAQQIFLAKQVRERVTPTSPEARAIWLETCTADPRWGEAVERCSRRLKQMQRLTDREAQARWERDYSDRVSASSQGEPGCDHVEATRPCYYCVGLRPRAAEAHLGWSGAGARRQLRGSEIAERAMRDCSCCGRDHDWRPVGDAQCEFCARYAYAAELQVSSQRWGGWWWIENELDRAAQAVATGSSMQTSVVPSKGGSDEINVPEHLRWYIESVMGRPDEIVATFLLPVAWRRTDTKQDVQKRTIRALNQLWNDLGIAPFRSTGQTTARRQDLERRLSWLWQHRVGGRSGAAIAVDTESPKDAEAGLTDRAIRAGIRRALAELS